MSSSVARFVSLLLSLVLGCYGCKSDGDAERSRVGVAPILAAPVGDDASPLEVFVREEDECLRRIGAASTEPTLPGAPQFDARRSHILARAKGHPVLLTKAPERNPEISKQAKALFAKLDGAAAKAVTLFRIYPEIVRNKPLAREVFLRDGYLYETDPALAFGMSHVVKLEDLFDDERLWLQRGSQLLELRQVRHQGQRFYVEEGNEGGVERRATLLFLDRVTSDREGLGEPLHRDLLPMRNALGFDRVTVRHTSREHVVVDAHYDAITIPTLFEADGAVLRLGCEAAPSRIRAELDARRARHTEWWAHMERVRGAIRDQIDEALPFDEPRTEYGQEDGKLREAWLKAYFEGRSSYRYNDDRYHVFRRDGRANVPQVCIDFIADTLERASGAWWQPRGTLPGKSLGGLDFDSTELASRRRVDDFVAFAQQHPDWFEVWQPERRVPLSIRERFFDFIEQHRDEFQVGDIVVIYGMRDDGELHYHSFFVFEKDPVTGMPIQLASNAIKPQVRSWEGEMHNAPRRSIRVRIRPASNWLAEVMSGTRREER